MVEERILVDCGGSSVRASVKRHEDSLLDEARLMRLSLLSMIFSFRNFERSS